MKMFFVGLRWAKPTDTVPGLCCKQALTSSHQNKRSFYLAFARQIHCCHACSLSFVAILVLLCLPISPAVANNNFHIAELEFKKSAVTDIIRVLAEDANTNIIATPEAGEKEVTIFLKNVSLEEAIKSICRVSNLWYRRDEGRNGTFRLMTKEQFASDLVVGQDDEIRVFQLHNPNVIAIATAIEDLYDERVEVSYGDEIQSEFGGGNSGNSGGNNQNNNRRRNNNSNDNRRNNNRNNSRGSGSRSGNQKLEQLDELPEDISYEHLIKLSEGGVKINSAKLTQVSGLNKTIYVTVNIEHNLLIVKTSDPGVLKTITQLVKQLDKPQTQVMLEMKIIEIKVDEDFSSLFNFELTNTGITGDSLTPITIGGAALTGGGSLMYEFISQSVKANIELLERNNRISTISSPMLVASNHRPAELFVGEERVVVTGYKVNQVDTNNISRTFTNVETEKKQIGTTLEVIPHINADGTIHLGFKQESSTLNEQSTLIPVPVNGGVSNLPIDSVTTARLKGEIFAHHGLTVAVGGLIRDSFNRNRRKVPYGADIPVIGNLLRSTTDGEEKSEIVLLITPYILNQDKQHDGFDPTLNYHKYAPNGQAMQSMPLPKQKQSQATVICGVYCAPDNMRNSDLKL